VVGVKISILVLACVLVAACGVGRPAQLNTSSGSTRQSVVAPVVHARAPALPSTVPVGFSHLPPGTYKVHLHAICSGSQGYHLAYLPDLVVGAAHSGQVLVPIADFGRGWCVIVYANTALNVVLATQRI
jgi:hypothetical protein